MPLLFSYSKKEGKMANVTPEVFKETLDELLNPIFQAGFTEDYLSDRKGILKARLQKAVANGDKTQAELLKLQINDME